jgi:non-specific serine/threonine protein kinase
VQALLSDLQSAMTTRTPLAKGEKSIVVLPFDNLSPDPDQEYFSDGLTEEIISDLSSVRALRVISRSSAMTFKGTRKRVADVARDLNVQYVLEGSVRKSGNNLRITAQLIDAPNDAHLWAEKYSGTLDDVFAIQERVSRSILEAMRLTLAPDEAARIRRHPISDIRAYEYYLKAIAEIVKFTERGTKEAERFLHNALDLVGENALLYAALASTKLNLANIGIGHEESLADAERYLQKALSLDPDLPQAHSNLGWLRFFAGRCREAADHLKRSLTLGLNDTVGVVILASVYMCAGKIPAAEHLCEQALRIDPVAYPVHWAQGGMYFYDGQFGKAREAWGTMYRMFPDNPYSRFAFALILIYHKDYDEAFRIIEENLKRDPANVLSTLGAMLKFAVLGEKDRAQHEMTPAFRKSCLRDLTYSHHIAGVFALLGDNVEAMDWIENAVGMGFVNYPFLAEKDLLLANIRSQERFKRLMVRVKKEWEEFEV